MKLEFDWAKSVPIKGRISLRFIQLMLNRMCFGWHRYENQPHIGNSLRHRQGVKRIKEKLLAYEKSGNQELLADIANYAMIEFMSPSHPRAHYKDEDQGRLVRPIQFYRERYTEKGVVMEE